MLLEKIKDEHVIGFKKNTIVNPNQYNLNSNDTVKIKEEDKKDEKNEILASNTIITMKESESLNFDNDSILRTSEKKNYEDEHLLDGMNKKEEIKSNVMKEIMNQLHNNQ